jgi:hypothetical protein
VVQLISSENYEVWFLDIQNSPKKVYGEWISPAFGQGLPMGINGIFAHPDASYHVGVGDLDNFELAVLLDP